VINTSNQKLKYIAAAVWIVGGIVLFLKSYSLLLKALEIDMNYTFIVVAIFAAFFFGLVKNKYLMSPFCVKNLKRIESIQKPKLHQFFEAKFSFFLTLMVITGAFLSRVAEGNYSMLLVVGTFDLALSTALLTSSVIFFRKENHSKL
jgi:cation transport ATPase